MLALTLKKGNSVKVRIKCDDIYNISLGYKQYFWLTMLGKYLYTVDHMMQVSKITMPVNSKPHSYIDIPQSC